MLIEMDACVKTVGMQSADDQINGGGSDLELELEGHVPCPS